MNLFRNAAKQLDQKKYPRSAKASFDETLFISHILKDLQQDSVMIDVGAHQGTSCSPFIDNGWKVFAFEPNPSTREKLIAKYNKCDNINIDSRAVSDKQAEGIDFYTSDVSTGISGMLAFHSSHEKKYKVNVTTVTDIIKEHNIDKIDFLKIDVEGYDFSVLKGVPWDKIQPDVIECEFEDAKTNLLGHSWKDICEYLVDKGYTVYVSEWHPVIRYGIAHDWHALKKYPCELSSNEAWGNLLAFRSPPTQSDLGKVLDATLGFRRASQPQPQPQLQPPPMDLMQNVMGTLMPFFNLQRWLNFLQRNKLIALQFIFFVLSIGVSSAVFFMDYDPKYYFLLMTLLISFSFLSQLQSMFHIKRLEKSSNSLTLNAGKSHSSYQKSIEEMQSSVANLKKDMELKYQDVELKYQDVDLKYQDVELKYQDVVKNSSLINGAYSSIRKMSADHKNLRNELVGNKYHTFNRSLTKSHITILIEKWQDLLNISFSKYEISYLANRICMTEDLSRGRLATAIQDIVLRTLVCKSNDKDKVIVAEIGSLFGIGLSSIYNSFIGLSSKLHLIAIDPLDGYYGSNRRDPFTGELVNEVTFFSNMDLFVPAENYTLLKHLSTDKKAIDYVNKTGCDVMIIDGDHSYEGVKQDFDLYLPLVNKGGYIIFDDYDVKDWPEVKDFVDKEVMLNPAVEFVGAEWRTAVFRVL